MAVSGLRLSREPQEDRTMDDTTETGRGSRPMEQTPVPTTVTVEVSDLGDVFSMLPSEVLATNILRRWDREKIESFARHLLGDEPHVVPANLAPVPVSDRTRCSWTLSGDRWIAACGTDTPDCPPPPNCPGCGCRIVTEKTNGDTKAEWTKVLRDPCYYQRNIGSVLSGAIKDAIDYIDAQGEKIDRLTTLNTSLNEQNASLVEENVRLTIQNTNLIELARSLRESREFWKTCYEGDSPCQR